MKKEMFTKFWRGNVPILAALIACSLTCLLSGQRFMFGCLWWECVDNGYFESQDIQLPREFFPEDAAYGTAGADRHTYGAKQLHAQQIFWGVSNHSTALLHVSRYFGTSGAKRGFTTNVRILGELFHIPLEQYEKLNYQSALADQFFAGCSVIRCVFVARYDEDLIVLNMTSDTQSPPEVFERIITYLDTVAAKRLGH